MFNILIAYIFLNDGLVWYLINFNWYCAMVWVQAYFFYTKLHDNKMTTIKVHKYKIKIMQ